MCEYLVIAQSTKYEWHIQKYNKPTWVATAKILLVILALSNFSFSFQVNSEMMATIVKAKRTIPLDFLAISFLTPYKRLAVENGDVSEVPSL